MKARSIVVGAAVAAFLASAGYGLYSVGMSQGMKMGSGKAAEVQPGRKVLYWHDPMVPAQKFDKPGKSPFMDMQLVPVYADEGGAETAGVRIDPRVQQNLGIRIAEVTRASFATPVEAVGSVAYNEREISLVQARNSGYVERLYVRAPLDPVRAGQPLLDLYVPEWVAAQEEYLAVRRMGSNAPAGLADAALQRMRLAGMTDAQVAVIAREGAVHPRVTITSPRAGVVGELSAREGMTVANGAPLFRINGLDTVWVNAEIPEAAAASVQPGAQVEATTAAFPGETFKGKVAAILPEVNAATRTLKARIEVNNPRRKLVPGMFAQVKFTRAGRPSALAVASEALIRTGERDLVMVADDNGGFTPVQVKVGAESGGRSEILEGLKEGDRVVLSGQFLIDSEASLRGVLARNPHEGKAPEKQEQVHRGQGKVEALSRDEITLSHGPIASLQWPAMTMGFRLASARVPADLKVGDTVSFETRQGADGQFEIVTIAKQPGAAK